MNMRQLDPASGEDALVLLRRVLLSAPDSALLISIRERSAEIREALLECNDDLSDKELAAVAENPEWVAKVYGGLGVDDEEIDEAEAEIEEAIESMQASEDEEIGIAFAALLDGLPAAYRSWEWIFSDVPTVSNHVLDGLRAHASVAGKHELVEGLLRYGITPATIFDATVGISLFVDRLLESIHDGHAVLCFDKAASSVAPDGGLHSQLLAQIRATPACPPQAAPRLLWWLAKVANLRPYLFDGYFTTEVTPGSLQFIADHSAADFDIVRRWTQTAAIPAFETVACKVATSGSWKFTMR